MNKFYIAIQNPSGDAKALSRVQVLDSNGSIVSIYADSSGTPFTDGAGSNVNYCVADEQGMVEFYWTAATSQTLQILDSAGNLERSIADFANNYSTPEAEADVSTILGATVADGDFGTFTGTTIADDSTAKVALQALETAVETKTTAATLAATGGAALTGANDASSGAKYTTVQGFITYLLSSVGSSIVGFLQSGTGAVARTAQAKMRETVSVMDFGATGDGTTSDSAAFILALAAASGGCVVAPAATGYRLTAQITIPAGTKLEFLGGKGQLVYKDHTDHAFILKQGAQVFGGDFQGGYSAVSKAGGLFYIETAQGGQICDNFLADTLWQDPIIYFEIDGGSQSVFSRCSLGRDGAVTGSGEFAIVMADAVPSGASPRQFSNINFNGTPSFSFGGCNNVQISNCYCADLEFSTNSRAVRMSSTRVGNQTTLNIRGANHFLNADWSPVLTIVSGTDTCEIGGNYNSGYPVDNSGNGRNIINYAEHSITPVIYNDATPLVPTAAYGAVSRSGSTYSFHFRFLGVPLSTGFCYVGLPAGSFTSSPVEFYGVGRLFYDDGSAKEESLVLKVLPTGSGDRILVSRADGSYLGSSSPASSTITAIHGFVQYAA